MFIRWVMDSWVGNYPFGPNSVIDLGHQFLKLNGPFFLLLVGVVWLGLRPWSYTRHDVSLVLGLSPAQVCLVAVGGFVLDQPMKTCERTFLECRSNNRLFLCCSQSKPLIQYKTMTRHLAVLSHQKMWKNKLWFQSNPNNRISMKKLTQIMHWSAPIRTSHCMMKQITLFAVLWLVLIWCERKILLVRCSEQNEKVQRALAGSKSCLSRTTHHHFDEYV